MASNDVLFLLLPTELLSFEVPDVFDLLALLPESLMSLVINLLQILDVLLALGLSMVIHLEGSLGSHEVRVRIMVVSPRDLLTRKGKSDQAV